MDKNKENIFDVPAADIQDKITLLMGLPPEEASARLDKATPPKRIGGKKIVITPLAAPVEEKTDEPPVEEVSAIAMPEPVIKDEADDKAVDDIVKHEGEALLSADEKRLSEFVIPPRQPKGIKRFLLAWWRNKLARNMTLFIVLAVVGYVIAVPNTRYTLLNAAGVRAGMQFQVIDKISGRPIKNVDVVVADVTIKSNDDGYVRIEGLKLGDTTVILKKRSFKEEAIPVTIGWGSNPFDAPMELVPTGSTFTFITKDWLSGLPLQNVEVSDGDSVALSDKDGVALLTIEPTDDDITTQISYNTYRTESVTIPADSTSTETIMLVPDKQDVFISKRQGKYDIYSRFVDGTQETLLLPGTGSEQADTHLLTRPTEALTAVVSSREGERNKDGYIMSNVYLLNPQTKVVEKIEGTSSERIRLIGWSGDAIVFVKTIAGPSAYTGNRQRVVSYDISDKTLSEMAAADYFTDVRVIGDSVYYVLPLSDGSQSKGLTKSSINGKEKKVLLAKNIWAVYRVDENTLKVSAEGDEWYEITVADSKVNKLEGAPAVAQNKVFIANPSTGQIAWLEDRDGKSTLLVSDKEKKLTEVLKQAGMSYPIRWLNESTIMYTIANAQETANYVVSTNNSAVKKVGDVTVSVYSDNQYYY